MGKLTRTHLVETAIWLMIAAVGFYYSFDFEDTIGTYKFGASGWPRAVLALIVVAALGNLVWHYLNGDDYGDIIGKAEEAHRTPSSSPSTASSSTASLVSSASQAGDNESAGAVTVEIPHQEAESRGSYYLRIVPVIALPFIYGYLLEGIGFYSLTPPFIALLIFVMGERSLPWLIGITFLIYGLLLFLFAKVLFVGLPVGNWHPFYDYSQWLIPAIQNSYFLEFLGLVVVIPLAIYTLTQAKGATDFKQAMTTTGIIYAGLFAFATLAAYLVGGPSRTFILFDVLMWPLGLLS